MKNLLIAGTILTTSVWIYVIYLLLKRLTS